MNLTSRVAVTSRSFSKNKALRDELLSRYKNVTFNDEGKSLRGKELIEFLQGHDKAITALETIDDILLSELPDLKVIGKYGVGLDMIDLRAMKKNGVALGWTGGVNKRSVSELVMAFAISMLRFIPQSTEEVKQGVWRQHVGRLLSGKTVGIVGCGFVGKDLVQLLQPFGCEILVNDIESYEHFYKQYNVNPVSFPDLLSRADIVSLHVPLDNTTRSLIAQGELAMMKNSAILINAARGNIVDEDALYRALIDGSIAAAAFDVMAIEPPTNVELMQQPNFLLTPHIGGSAEEVILNMGRAAIAGLDDYMVPS